ncbi:Hypothetical predicted protein [Octopus vulgaris]|uniref:Uncharacterized protein n=1 Tax=Octopus vulgaris TaxID=6645 RepID=A0AA36AK54_OCTVU|nr:Hypothetical predicted protein [Octopus vulgaris]
MKRMVTFSNTQGEGKGKKGRSENLIHTYISSAFLRLEMTGDICLKSPNTTYATPPIDLLLPFMSTATLVTVVIRDIVIVQIA